MIYFLIVESLYWLKKTDASFGVYLLLSVLAIGTTWQKKKDRLYLTVKKDVMIAAVLYAVMVTLANYSIPVVDMSSWKDFTQFASILRVIVLLFIFLGSVATGYVICDAFPGWMDSATRLITRPIAENGVETVTVAEGALSKRIRKNMFWTCFLVECVIGLTYLFLMCYPGIVLSDNVALFQVDPTEPLREHYPVVHAWILRFFYGIGSSVFGTPNAGVATYTVMQIVSMALIYAYALDTVYAMGIRKEVVTVLAGCYLLLPYQINFLCNTSKDTLFAGCVLLFMTAAVRKRRRLGGPCTDVLIVAGGAGMSLLRPNGLAAFLTTAMVWGIMAIITFRRGRGQLTNTQRQKKSFMSALVITLILVVLIKGPVISGAGILPTESSEPFSVPIQQISRVLVNGRDLPEEDLELIGRLIDPVEVINRYDPVISDPIKSVIGDHEELRINKGLYVSLWLRTGVRYPADYLFAWVDLTKGYWNAGYDSWIGMRGVATNGSGIYEAHPVMDIVYIAQSIFRILPGLNLTVAVGLHVWLLFLVLWYMCKRHEADWWIAIPLLMIFLTLLVGSPVSLFRYIYALIICLPMVYAVAFTAGMTD